VLRRTAGEISHIVQVVSAHLFLLVYPGLFTWHAARLVSLEANSELILVFLLAVYLNDSMAWLFGRLFGHHEQTHRSGPAVAVSPNKSWTGFVAGFLASIAVVGLTGRLWPAILPGPTVLHLILGAVVGLAAITGDLVESGLKRSAAVKDSGQLIPGRGGLLDSIDSALFTAPFFYYGVVILYAL
jgi:phosphatidate cytidylyltransferase